MDTRIIKFFFVIILSLGVVSSLETMKPAELNKPYTILQSCKNSTFANFTLSNKDGHIVENIAMSSNGSSNYVYSVTPTQVGRHDVNGICDVDGVNTPFATYFEVTGTGFTNTLGFYFLIIILSIGLILLGFFVRDATITILGTFGLYFFGIYVLFYGIDGIKDAVYTWALGIITLVTAAYVSIKAAYEGYLS